MAKSNELIMMATLVVKVRSRTGALCRIRPPAVARIQPPTPSGMYQITWCIGVRPRMWRVLNAVLGWF